MNELKTINQLTLKVDGDTVKGLATVFGVVDSYGDRSHSGLFANAVPGKVRFLWNHQMDSVPVAVITGLYEIGRADLPTAVRVTLPEATGGVVVERRYLDTARGQEVKAAVVSGAVTEMSYGFDPVRSAMTRAADGTVVRELQLAELWEISDVALRGAVPGTMANMAAKAGYHYSGGLHLRTGARHSAGDSELINTIASAAYDLGATTVQRLDQSKHDPLMARGRAFLHSEAQRQPPIWLLKARLALLDV